MWIDVNDYADCGYVFVYMQYMSAWCFLIPRLWMCQPVDAMPLNAMLGMLSVPVPYPKCYKNIGIAIPTAIIASREAEAENLVAAAPSAF
jgi:hypothetical protein